MPTRLPKKIRQLLEDQNTTLVFSAASLWEISIKNGLNRADLKMETKVLRRELIERGYVELAISSEHAINIESLPRLHKDPFDRLLISYPIVEGITLLTADKMVATYPAPVQKI